MADRLVVVEAVEGRHSRLEVGWGEAALRVGDGTALVVGEGRAEAALRAGEGEEKRSDLADGRGTGRLHRGSLFTCFFFPIYNFSPKQLRRIY